MNNTPQSQLDARAVGAFFAMSEGDLSRFAEELGIQLNVRELQFCQRYFKHAYRRVPIVAELRFIATYLAAKRPSPLSLLPFDLTFAETETARAFGDMMRKSAVIRPNAKKPDDLLSLLNISGDYLKRAGHAPRENDILCLGEEELALMTSIDKPRLSLSLGDKTAVLVTPDKRMPSMPSTVLAINESDPRLLPQVTAKIMEITAGLGVAPLMQLGDDGLFPALTALPYGIEIFSPVLSNGEDDPYRVMNDLYKNALLITLPEAVVPSLLATGMPLRSIGKLLDGDAIIVHHPHATVSLDKRLLWELNTLAISRLRGEIPAASPCEYVLGEVKDHNELLCGMTGTGTPTSALLSLLAVAFKAGVKTKALRFHATLSCNRQSLTAALAIVAALHRTTTELALASLPARVIMSDDAQPRLTLAMAAPLSSPPPDDVKIAAFEDAAAHADYAALRAFLY